LNAATGRACLDMPGLPNLAHVEKAIYRGARPRFDQGGLESLRKLGVKTIVNLQGGDLTAPSKVHWPDWSHLLLRLEPGEAPSAIAAEAAAAKAAGIETLNVPMDALDPVTPAEAAGLERVLNLLAAAGADAPVFVHCEKGKDRTGLTIALYRMRSDGWTAERAAAEMAEMGHRGILNGLWTGNMDVDRVLKLFPRLAVRPS
jgi:protein tyrosine/serine phosphatase